MADRYNQSWVLSLAQPGYKRWAITIGQTTYYSCSEPQVDEGWRNHENIHKSQWKKYGWRFALMYLKESKKGYEKNKYEVEANE
jgi:hypothetical protein